MAFTDEEIASFEAFQRGRGQSTDLAHAPARDLLAFMEDTARKGDEMLAAGRDARQA
ncbi:hypothetical protein [uncultured Jannaschia sp.]|uniref:hypothetical protein n=1 Tax=uncultured Jannaschia sp. TaxID=293347 RepID=UPI00262EE380|nr:hypothetical protein [uncultured Jannaschia sp.]